MNENFGSAVGTINFFLQKNFILTNLSDDGFLDPRPPFNNRSWIIMSDIHAHDWLIDT